MRVFTRSSEIVIDAAVHDVFEYCRDPRHLFEGWPFDLEVTDVKTTPEGVGTSAHIVGRSAMGMKMHRMLEALKTRVESQATSAS